MKLQALKYETKIWKSAVPRDMLTRKEREFLENHKTYQSAICQEIKNLEIDIPGQLQRKIDNCLILLARFDSKISEKNYSIPHILLRSESASSSQIEHLSASAKNIALASFSDDAPHNSKMISNNIQAMLEAIHKSKELSKKTILDIHNALMGNIPSAKEFAGKFRTEQVWIGGSNLGPFNAYFVPPDYKLIDKAINDLILFINSDKINPIVKAAISHAQFETIHPFVDGNGRTGRSLLHAILLHDEALLNTSVPISAGLLNNLNSYFKALDSYREGNELLIIDRFCDAIIEAVKIASILVEKIEELLDFWRNSINARSDAKIWDLLELLIEQPVVGAQFISERLSISLKASYNVIDFAIEKNILQKIGNKYRGVFYVCNSVTDLLDSISSEKSLRRLLPKS